MKIKTSLLMIFLIFFSGCATFKGSAYRKYRALDDEASQKEQAGRLDEAAALYRDILDMKLPRKEKNIIRDRLALLYERMGEYEEQIKILESLISSDRKRSGPVLRLAGVYSMMDLDQKALELYMRAYEMKDVSFQLTYGLGKTNRKLGNYIESEIWLKEAARSDPEDENLLIELAALYMEKGDAARATSYLQKLAELYPKAEYFEELGSAYLLRKLPENAIESFKKASSLGRPSYYRLEECFAYYTKGDISVSEEMLGKIKKQGDPGVLAHLLNALICLRTGRKEDARRHLRVIKEEFSDKWLDEYVDYLAKKAR